MPFLRPESDHPLRYVLALVVVLCVLWAAGSCYSLVWEARRVQLGEGLRTPVVRTPQH